MQPTGQYQGNRHRGTLVCSRWEQYLGRSRHSEDFKREVSSGDMSVDGDGAPQYFVFARLQLGKRNSQQGPIRLIDLDVTLIDLQSGDIEYLNLTQGGFQLLGEPDLHLYGRAMDLTSHRRLCVVDKCMRPASLDEEPQRTRNQ